MQCNLTFFFSSRFFIFLLQNIAGSFSRCRNLLTSTVLRHVVLVHFRNLYPTQKHISQIVENKQNKVDIVTLTVSNIFLLFEWFRNTSTTRSTSTLCLHYKLTARVRSVYGSGVVVVWVSEFSFSSQPPHEFTNTDACTVKRHRMIHITRCCNTTMSRHSNYPLSLKSASIGSSNRAPFNQSVREKSHGFWYRGYYP